VRSLAALAAFPWPRAASGAAVGRLRRDSAVGANVFAPRRVRARLARFYEAPTIPPRGCLIFAVRSPKSPAVSLWVLHRDARTFCGLKFSQGLDLGKYLALLYNICYITRPRVLFFFGVGGFRPALLLCGPIGPPSGGEGGMKSALPALLYAARNRADPRNPAICAPLRVADRLRAIGG